MKKEVDNSNVTNSSHFGCYLCYQIVIKNLYKNQHPPILNKLLHTAEVNKQLERGKEKLASLKSICKDIDPGDRLKTEEEHDKLCKEWRKRKRMCMDVVRTNLMYFLPLPNSKQFS